MAKSIIQTDKTRCYICGKNAHADYWGLDEHHVYSGANRKSRSVTVLKCISVIIAVIYTAYIKTLNLTDSYGQTYKKRLWNTTAGLQRTL